MSTQPTVVILGIMGRTPVAGVAWQTLHYLEGFRRLGCDIFYVEDTGQWPYDAEQNTITSDCRYTTDYIGRLMAYCGLPGRWAYRSGVDGKTFGLAESQISSLFDRTAVLVNLSGGTVLRDEHLRVPIRIFLETDPVRLQIEVAKGVQPIIDWLGAHTHHFTYGENLGTPDCTVPIQRYHYHPTRQPIVLDWWASTFPRFPGGDHKSATATFFTTISSWRQSGCDVNWNGETYVWSKHLEFLKFLDLPLCTEQPLELALAGGDAEAIKLLMSRGWRVIDAITLSKDILPYRDYILRSRGEFTVAKDQYVRPRSGWFSDRSACYLAAGRPVITQDTGFGTVLPTGEGLFAFNTMEEILMAIEAINSDYEKHCRAAQAIAGDYFKAETVLAKFLRDLGL